MTTNPNLVVQDGNLANQNLSGMQDSDLSIILIRTAEHRKATFRYAGNFTPVAAPTDVIQIKGSATQTGRIKRIALGGVATANGNMQATLIRRSTIGTIGSAVVTNISPGKLDTNDPANTVLVGTIGTANWTTPGTSAGNLGQGRLFLPTTATGTPNMLVWEFATRQDKALILRGVSDWIYINLNGGAVPAGGTIDYEIEIEEDLS